ncbi:MAG TPA: ankyrin repeat domain-containing protein [Gemmataceae bacterium]|nr:ankyrin repeat domain-containing protein [Gemmataceae bacterium]
MELFDAIEQHDLKRLVELLVAGADPNLGRPHQPFWTPLKAAVEAVADGGPVEAVILLLRHRAAVDGGRTPGDATPLIVAMINRQPEAARILLAAGADPNARDDEGDTPLRLSTARNDHATRALLVLCGGVEHEND